MTRLAAFAAFALLVAGAASFAQESPGRRAPLVLGNDTVSIVHGDQPATLLLPKGKPPFPAVILMHGCGGVTANMYIWAVRLASWGYAALVLDSFGPRGIDTVCGHRSRFLPRERAADAFAAAAWLRQRPDIDGTHLGLIGFSHGASTALAASVERRIAALGVEPFKAVVAYYPYCPGIAPDLASDVQILIGSNDDWTPAQRCTDWLPMYADGSPHKPLLKVYPGALHVFDANAPRRVYFGHHLAYDAAAAADSFRMTRHFLDSHLKPASPHE